MRTSWYSLRKLGKSGHFFKGINPVIYLDAVGELSDPLWTYKLKYNYYEKYSTKQNAIQSVNTALINLYWLIGQQISRRISAASWGKKTIDELANHLKVNQPELKGFSRVDCIG
ncbi:MAG: DUF1016 N-terminal domain-containing protein [Dyadobacter sp.]|uniref:DUF1016 N-terminal domain-containing protein n=1 Tax=Dyadobacter sp. TaxID=1914288 RepID=UPI0032678D24